MRRTAFFALLIAAFFIGSGLARAQKQAGPKYDPATEVTVKGVIEEVKDFQCPVSGGVGAHIILKGNDEVIHLALSKFLKEYEFTFAKGDEVEVVGSKVTMDGKPTILAKTVIRGQNTYNFRDAKGNPLW
jgi:DNA/RNA endonuclease YhcR with UshA esterase domain